MPQLYPNPISSTQGLTINTAFPLTGGGQVALGQSITLGVSTSQSVNRMQYSVSPAPDGGTANFTIDDTTPALSVSYVDTYINRLLQNPADYSLTGNVLSFNTAPLLGDDIYAVFAQPNDSRQITGVSPAADGVTTTFTFPSFQPLGTYVDVYLDGVWQEPSVDYYLNIVNGAYSLEFTTAPSSGATILAVFNPSTVTGRNAYALTPAADGSTTSFQIKDGAPSTAYVDVFAAGQFQAEGADYSLSFESGVWKIDFVLAPTAGSSLYAVFAPSTTLPPSQSGGGGTGSSLALETDGTPNGDQTLLNLEAGTNITLTDDGAGTIRFDATGSGGSSNHFVGTGGAPTYTLGVGAGGGTASVVGTDASGSFTVVPTGPLPTGNVITINFAIPYVTAPYVVITPNTADGAGTYAQQAGLYVTSTTAGFTLVAGSNPLNPTFTYGWNYLVIG